MRLPARLGSYDLQSELGRGAMGVVYRATDRRLRREVALKVLPPTADKAGADAFLREARAAARLRHPGIVVVYDAEIIEGARVVALELVAGDSLAAKLRKDRVLPAREAARLVAELASAVHAAHQEGIVHRDLKPANVLVEKDGRPRLADFGLARDERGKILSQAGDVVGTPAYMAPEQARGETDRIGPWTDVWGLGAVLFHCLAGEPPYFGKTAHEVLERVAGERVRDPNEVRRKRGLEPLAPDLAAICLKALDRERDRRYTTAAALEDDLRRFHDGRPVQARRTGLARRGLDGLARHRLAIGLGLGSALLAAAALIVVPGALERSRRRAHWPTVLANVGSGEGRFLREKAVFELTKDHDDAAVPLLVAALDRTTEKLNAVTREQLLAVATPRNDAEKARQPRLARLAEALAALEKASPDRRVERELVRAVAEARRRLELRANRGAGSASRILAGEHRRKVGDEELLRGLVALEALGDLGKPEAWAAIGRHLHAAEDDERGVAAAKALGRLRDARAARCVLRVDDRPARGGAFDRKAMHALAAELGGAIPPYALETGLDYLDRGRLRALLDDKAGAIEDMTKAVALDPRDALAWASRSDLFIIKRDWAAACTDLEHAVALAPDEATFLASHAYVLSERKELDRALEECDRAIALDPGDARSWSTRGSVRVKKKDRAGALADLSRAIELDPGAADPWAERAELREAEDPAAAIEDDTRAIELDPTMAAAWNNRACAKHNRKDYDGALADYARAIELDPTEPRQHTNRANTQLARGDYASAIADATTALKFDARDAHALCIRGRARVYTADMDGAKADLDRAVELAPADPSVWSAVAIFRLASKDDAGALAAVDKQVELAPDDAGALTSRGFVRMRLGQVNEGIEDCKKATELRPLDPTVWDNLADVLLDAHDFKGALDANEKKLRLDPHSPGAWRRSAQLRLWLGELVQALDDANRAVELDGHDAANLLVRAMAHRHLRQDDLALKDFRAALSYLRPNEDPSPINKQIEEIERGR